MSFSRRRLPRALVVRLGSTDLHAIETRRLGFRPIGLHRGGWRMRQLVINLDYAHRPQPGF